MNFIVIFFSIFLYFLRALFFYLGLRKEKSFKDLELENLPQISIIVPARNEENNIKSVIESISNLEYPTDKIELIIINDRSTDKTLDQLNDINSQIDIQIIDIQDDKDKNGILGKAGAVHIGILKAKNEHLLFTDADCVVNKKWVNRIMSVFNSRGSDFIASFTLVISKNFFQRYQGAEWGFLHTMACGALNMGIPMGCFGNNIAFKKSAYLSFGGYENIDFSVTEDLALLQTFHRNGFKINYLNDFESTVETKPANTAVEFIRQHHRWLIGGQSLGIRATIFVISSLSIWAGLVYTLFNQDLFGFGIVLFSRIILDLIVLYPSMSKVKKNYSILELSFYSVLFLINELFSPFYLLFRKVKWKDQIFKS